MSDDDMRRSPSWVPSRSALKRGKISYSASSQPESTRSDRPTRERRVCFQDQPPAGEVAAAGRPPDCPYGDIMAGAFSAKRRRRTIEAYIER